MNNLKRSISSQKWLSIKLFAAACFVLIFQCFTIQTVTAQGNGVTVSVEQVHSTLCDTFECCIKIHVDVAAGAKLYTFEISSFVPNGAPSTVPGYCFDVQCPIQAGHQYVSNGAILFRNTAPPPPKTPTADSITGKIHFDFSTPVTGPGVFEFLLCARNGCAWTDWTSFNWTATTDVTGRIPFHGQETGTQSIGSICGDNEPLCPECDQVNVYRPNDCYMKVCLTQHFPSAGSHTFNLFFTPPLPSYPCTPLFGCGPTSPTVDTNNELPNWVIERVNDSNWTIRNTHTDSLRGCETVCFDFPICDGIFRHVSVTNDNGPCANSDSGSFKKASSEKTPDWWKTGSQNYPNPLSAQTQFKTVIPFNLPTEGDARISILDASGRIVFKDVQTFSGSGKHFFYFTGEQLPSGKYFYTIESPVGAVIVKQSLLIVR